MSEPVEPQFNSVWSFAWYRLWQIKGQRTKTVLILVLIGVALGLSIFPPLVPLSFFALLAYFGYVFVTAHHLFMREFAALHHLTYRTQGEISSVRARLFNFGHSRTLSNVMSGEWSGHPFRLFNYSCTTGSGKHQTTHHFTVGEISTEKTFFPHILLKPAGFSFGAHGRLDHFGQDKDREIKLEPEFAEDFKLYCQQDYEIEVLQIFTTDFLRFFKREFPKYSLEFSGRNLYCYRSKLLTRWTELEGLLTAIKRAIERVGPLLNRLHDDFDSLHEYYQR